MKGRIRTALGTICAAGILALCACGPTNPVIGTGESSILVTNDLGMTITSLEVLAGAPEGFETIMPTEDVQTIESGQTVEVKYEVGETTYDPGTVGSGQTDQTSNQPIAEPTGDVGEAPNAVQVDQNGQPTSDSGEEALVDEAIGTSSSSTSGTSDSKTTTSTTGVESMPIVGDAIRVVADGKTLVFDGLDLPNYKEVSLRTTSDGVNYVDYVDVDGKTGNTKEAATTALQQWEAAQKQAKDSAATTTTDANATAGQNTTTNSNTSSSGSTTGTTTNNNATTVDPNSQGINGDGLGEDETPTDPNYEGINGDGLGEDETADQNGEGINADGRDPNE